MGRRVPRRGPVPADIRDALNAAAVVGDDFLPGAPAQTRTTGRWYALTTSRETLPSTALLSADMPRVPMTIAGASSSAACSATCTAVGRSADEDRRCPDRALGSLRAVVAEDERTAWGCGSNCTARYAA